MMKPTERIRKIRKSRKLTLRELSNLTEIAVSSLSRIERGKLDPKMSQLLNIAQALGVDPGSLISVDDMNANRERFDER